MSYQVYRVCVLIGIACLAVVCEGTLDCFSCTNVASLEECHTVQQCRLNEYCYTEYRQSGTSPKIYTLGCREKELCVGIDQTALLGRRRRQGLVAPPMMGCKQCCSLHGCNKYLCPVRTLSFPTIQTNVDGGWTSWGAWGVCSSSCGIGLQSRYRSCSNPTPIGSGRNCLGDAKDVNICTATCTAKPPVIVPMTTATTMRMPPTNAPAGAVTSKYTLAPGECRDIIDCSDYYPPEACHGAYEPWARAHCAKHCEFCIDPNQVPVPCVDKLVNCHEYQSDICTAFSFWQWRETNCRKFCKLC